MTNDVITLAANIALALSFIIGLILGIVQVKAAARDRRERLTLEELRNFQSREFAELIQYINTHDVPKTRKELLLLPVNEQVIFMQLAQQMEMLGILVGERIINIDLVDKTLGSFITTTWDKYKTMMLSMRGEDPFLAEYFQWVAENIENRMLNKPRKPFHEIRNNTIYN